MSTRNSTGDRPRLSLVQSDDIGPERGRLPYDERVLEHEVLTEVADFVQGALGQLPEGSRWHRDLAADVRLWRIAAGLPVIRTAADKDS